MPNRITKARHWEEISRKLHGHFSENEFRLKRLTRFSFFSIPSANFRLEDRTGERILPFAILDLDDPQIGIAGDRALDIGGRVRGGKRAGDLEPAERAF